MKMHPVIFPRYKCKNCGNNVVGPKEYEMYSLLPKITHICHRGFKITGICELSGWDIAETQEEKETIQSFVDETTANFNCT